MCTGRKGLFHQDHAYTIKCLGTVCFLTILIAAGCAHEDKGLPVGPAGFTSDNNPVLEKEYVKPLSSGLVEATGIAIISNITPEEARKKAILNACTSAIQYFGVQVSQRDIDIQAESNHKTIHNDFMSLTSLTTHGVILEKVVVDEKVLTRGNNILKYVKLQVRMGRQEGGKDPYFTVKASLNRDVFKVNDTLSLTVSATHDCYLTILDITDEDVYILFPNTYCSGNFLPKGEKFSFPGDDRKKTGLSIPAMLPAGKDKDMGVIKVLATKKETSFDGLCAQSEYGAAQISLQDLLAFIVKIPLDEMEEVDMPYMITR